MIVVRPARASDFDRVYSLLKEFNVPFIDREGWRQLFVDHWGCQNDLFGYMLLNDEVVVGFMGLILSKRKIRGKEHLFCNLTSWITRELYRTHSLKLLYESLKIKNVTFTNLTPGQDVGRLLERMRFKVFEESQTLLRPVHRWRLVASKVRVTYEGEGFEEYLSPDEMRIYRDHLKLANTPCVITSKNEACLIIINKRESGNAPWPEVYYISNPDLFSANAHMICSRICSDLDVKGLVVDSRYMLGRTCPGATPGFRKNRRFYLSHELEAKDIDTLYSELPVLHL